MSDKYDIQLEDLPESIRDIAEAIGLGNMLELVRLCGGLTVYIPKLESCELEAKKRQIFKEYKESKSGYVFTELAKKFNLSESHVRAIVREKRLVISPKAIQIELF